jgi:sulfatase-like protein
MTPADRPAAYDPRLSIGFLRAALHLGALWALAFVQPLFGLLGDSAEFFVARGNTAFDIIVFAFAYAFVPPLIAAALVWAVGRIDRRAGWAVHLTLIALLVAALLLPPLGDALSGSAAAIAVALALGAGAAFLYTRAAGVRSFLTVLSPAPLIFLLLFLVFSPVSDLLVTGEAVGSVPGPTRSSTPIVHIVLDELPMTTVTGADGKIDAALFPNLARFAGDATWYRNATTVADTTSEAVPAQLTGMFPKVGDLPTPTDHPNSLFSLFKRSHELSVVEPVSDVCPKQLCPEPGPSTGSRLSALAGDLRIVAEHLLLPDDVRAHLPAVDRGWLGFGSDSAGAIAGVATEGGRGKLIEKVIAKIVADDPSADFARVTASIDDDSRKPPLIFMHSTLPHGPSKFLPDGTAYPIHRSTYPGYSPDHWDPDRQWLADESFQRHVLQMQYTDLLVGRLLNRVRAAGLYDKAVIVVAADHGVSFHAGEPRRRITPNSMADIAVVPFLVKLPGQHTAKIDDRAVRTIDALPTIAKAAGVTIPWKTDGMPADERPVDPAATIEVMNQGQLGTSRPLGDLLAARDARQAYETKLLRNGVYEVGPRPNLIGRDVEETPPPGTGPHATIDQPGDFAAVADDAPVLPAFLSGAVTGLPADAVLAVAVNGRIEATTRVYPWQGHFEYVAMLRAESLHPGANTVTVLQVLPGDQLRVIGAT